MTAGWQRDIGMGWDARAGKPAVRRVMGGEEVPDGRVDTIIMIRRGAWTRWQGMVVARPSS